MADDPSFPAGFDELQEIAFRLADVVMIGVPCPNEQCERQEVAVALDRPYRGKRCLACGEKLPRRLVERLRQCVALAKGGSGVTVFIRLPPGTRLAGPLYRPARGHA